MHIAFDIPHWVVTVAEWIGVGVVGAIIGALLLLWVLNKVIDGQVGRWIGW